MPEVPQEAIDGLDRIYEALSTELQKAQRYATQPDARDGGRLASIVALDALLNFMKHVPGINERGLHYVIANLKHVLLDVERCSEIPPMLQCQGPPNRRRLTTAVDSMRAHAAVAMDMFMRSGLSRSSASQRVARELDRRGYRVGKRGGENSITPNQIARWRDAAAAGSPVDDLDAGMFEHAKEIIASHVGTVFQHSRDYEVRALALLDDLCLRHPPCYVLPVGDVEEF